MLIVFILVLANLLFSRELNLYMMIIISILLAVFLLNALYEKQVARHLEVGIIDKEIRKFKGQEGLLKVKVRQNGFLPVLGASINLVSGDDIKFEKDQSLKIRYQTETTASFSVLPKSEIIIEIPFTAVKREVGKIIKSEINIPRIFGFNTIRLESVNTVKHEIIIYPSLQQLRDKNWSMKMQQGLFTQNYSLYMDPMLVHGIKDYEVGDQLKDIHWKVSAKNNALKTKVYEKTTDISWMFLINLRSEHHYAPPKNIEEIFEKITYLTYTATKYGIPYQMMTNMKTVDAHRLFQLEKGSGKTHYKQTLDTLARIKTMSFTISFNRLLKHVQQHEENPTHIIFSGKTDTAIDKELHHFINKGIIVYQLDENELEKYEPFNRTRR